MALAAESWPKPLRNAVRVSNRYLLNPLMLRFAGRKHLQRPSGAPGGVQASSTQHRS